ncbi:thioesterase family protein [Paeniroseomonas aquatica]|uniref:Thioesterase family protein n=1 Tax=Paeniroseomonas aquatica TaxID=373043 RepID=A0ABT8AD72_9PROT|nr:thioesterase family protein [Paeniroseomonas aquatica]MDN3567284.1 thioesterase family protein [Paeniroseomonas aquatica]
MTDAERAEFGIEGGWAMIRRHRVRWSECDQYAHANNTAYLTLCEDLRVSHWLTLGGRFELGAPGPVVSQIEARYLRSLAFDDAVATTLRPGTIRRTSFTHEYAVWKQGLVFSCRTVLVLIVNGSGEKVPIPPAMRARLIAEGAREE